MITLAQAWTLLDRHTAVLGRMDIPVPQCAGWVASEDIRAPINVPQFRNSAMDGFAVATKRTQLLPATLETGPTLFAGGTTCTANDDNKAVKVMTGAKVPDAFDAVIPFEDVEYDDHSVTISHRVKAGQHIRLPGEDIAIGERVIAKGTVINPLSIGVLASLGIESVKSIRKPRALIINTGDELVAPGEPLREGQQYDSNGPTVQSMIERFCLAVDRKPITGDDLDTLARELQTDHDIVITTGGVSVGEKDFVPAAARKSGWQEIFHKVALKPGKPIFFAVRDGKLLFGLPGNPLSAAVTCALFVIPAAKKMMGRADCFPQLSDAELEGNPIRANRPVIWPGNIWRTRSHQVATIVAKRSSAALSALINSDGLIFQNFTDEYSLPRVQVCEWSQILK